MWKSLYDALLQALTVSWAEYIRSSSSAGKMIRDNFQHNIYPDIGLIFLVVATVFGVFYYYYLNFRFGRYYTNRTWWFILGLSSITSGLITYWKVKTMLNNPIVDVSHQLLWIGIINAAYAGVFFFMVSLLIKWFSPMGKRTPF